MGVEMYGDLLILLAALSYVTAGPYCQLPRGEQYERSIFRPHNSSTITYSEGQLIRHAAKIRIICRKDVLHDAITNWAFSKCRNGRWTPPLPSCIELKRCEAPPIVPFATVSRPISPHITFPHGTTLTYTCDEGKMATGSKETECKDGAWTELDLQCSGDVASLEAEPSSTPIVSAARLSIPTCDNIVVDNGRVTYLKHDIYSVACDDGFRLDGTAYFRCRAGEWVGNKPLCKKAHVNARPQVSSTEFTQSTKTTATRPRNRPCLIPREASRQAVLKIMGSDETIVLGWVDDWTTLVQTCVLTSGQRQRAVNVKCVNGNWRPGFQDCQRHRTQSRQRRIKTYRECVIPDWKEDSSFHTIHWDGSHIILRPGETVSHGNAVKVLCAENMTTSSIQNTIDGEQLVVCTDGLWEPELYACVEQNEAHEDFDADENKTIPEYEMASATIFDEYARTTEALVPDLSEASTFPTVPEFYYYEDNNPLFDSVYSDSDDSLSDDRHNDRKFTESDENLAGVSENHENDDFNAGENSKEDYSKQKETDSDDSDTDDSDKTKKKKKKKSDTSDSSDDSDKSKKKKRKDSDDSDTDDSDKTKKKKSDSSDSSSDKSKKKKRKDSDDSDTDESDKTKKKKSDSSDSSSDKSKKRRRKESDDSDDSNSPFGFLWF